MKNATWVAWGFLHLAAFNPLGGQIPVSTDPLDWGACEEGVDSAGTAECARVEVPLRSAEADGPMIVVAVMRMLPSGPSRRQLWFLDGGPGDAGRASLGRQAAVLGDSTTELYTFDHRGVGGTAILTCPEQQAAASPDGAEITSEEWHACADHVRTRPDLDALTVTESAGDLRRLIAMTRRPDTPVFVMGVSYGTFLANRYLQLSPDPPDGVILDGIVPADWSFVEFDEGLDRAGRLLLLRCGSDDDCGRRLAPNPVAFTEALIAKLGEGHCGGFGLTPQLTRLILGVMMMVDRIPAAMIPALVYRIDRCEWHDRMAVLHMFRELGELGEPASHSPVLQRHVALSELWRPDAPSAAELRTALEGYVMTTEVSASFAGTAPFWPVYHADPQDNTLSDYAGPMLMLHGTLDPTMPMERLDHLRGVYSRPWQTFVAVPDGGHVVVNEAECVRHIYRAFLDDPRSELDLSCVPEAVVLSLTADSAASRRLFGTPDMWGDEVTALAGFFFGARFKYSAVAMALLAPILALRRMTGWHRNVGARRLLKGIAIAGVWLTISLAAWQATALLPIVLPFDAAATQLALLAVLALQGAMGYGLVRALFGGHP